MSESIHDDTWLVSQIAQHNKVALSQLYDRYASRLYALAYRILGIPEETEEVVLDVFSQVWRNAASSYNRDRSRVDTWLFMLTRSRSLDRLRVLQRQVKPVEAVTDALTTASPNPLPEEELLMQERRDLVLAALKQLPAEQKFVLELAYYKGMTHAEIAAYTGKSMGTIKTRIRLGLSKLRGILDSESHPN
jgi:RNA polymerase sigma factor (sigma-70 family)